MRASEIELEVLGFRVLVLKKLELAGYAILQSCLQGLHVLPDYIGFYITPLRRGSHGIGGGYGHPYVDRIWLRVYYNEIPIYPIFYLLKGDYTLNPKP